MGTQPASADQDEPHERAWVPPPPEIESGGCPECGAHELQLDERHGELVCGSCWLVVDDAAIDYGPEWRAFNPQQTQDRARTGPGRTIMRHDLGLGTVIGYGRDANGQRLRRKQHAQFARMRRYHQQATYSAGADRELIRGLSEVERINHALGLPDRVAETAVQIYRKARDQRFLHGRSIEATAAATVYAAARIQGIPRQLDDVVGAAQSSEHDVARTYRRLSQELKLPVPLTYPHDLLPSFTSKLELPAHVERMARTLLAQADEAALAGKNPASVAAAALYIAAIEQGDRRTQKQVAKVAGVTEVTVRSRLQDLRPHLEAARDAFGEGETPLRPPAIGHVPAESKRETAEA